MKNYLIKASAREGENRRHQNKHQAPEMHKLNIKSKYCRSHDGEGDGCCREKERKETERKREEDTRRRRGSLGFREREETMGFEKRQRRGVHFISRKSFLH